MNNRMSSDHPYQHEYPADIDPTTLTHIRVNKEKANGAAVVAHEMFGPGYFSGLEHPDATWSGYWYRYSDPGSDVRDRIAVFWFKNHNDAILFKLAL